MEIGSGQNVVAGFAYRKALTPPGQAPEPVSPVALQNQALSLQYGDRQFPLTDGGPPLTLGRHPENQVVLESVDVSRHHAQVCLKDGSLYVLDNTSTYGTFVNGKPIKPGKWVEIGPQDQLSLAKQGLTFQQNESVDQFHFEYPAGTQYEVRVGNATPVDLGEKAITIGRDPASSSLTVSDPQVSRQHATVQAHDGVLYICDEASSNGTTVNGETLEPRRWASVAPSANLTLGKSTPLKFQPKISLPDGREALITPLPNGKVRVEKVDLHSKSEEISGLQLVNREKMTPCASAEQLEVGQTYLSFRNGSIRPFTYYGTDGHGRHRLGHTDEYTPEKLAEYIDAQARFLKDQQEARDARQAERQQKAQELREKTTLELGLQNDLGNSEALAQKLLAGHANLAYDGHDAWPKEVLERVSVLKRGQLEAQPGLKERGLVDVRMEEWLASKRGEMVLYRGVRDAYDAHEPGKFYTDVLGTAIHTYALGDNARQSDVIALRMPISDAFRMRIDVGLLPGINPYANVIKVDVDELDYPVRPQLVLSSVNPEQAWVFQGYRQLDQLGEGKSQRFSQLDREIQGKA